MARPNDLAHFAIHADDCERARHFYERVFGWHFLSWGTPGVWMIRTSLHAPVYGTLQQREHPAASGGGMRGFECTIAVADVSTLGDRIVKAGGKILAPPALVEGVGTVIRFEDTEGNPVSAMRYEEHRH
ncbi:VOC family protein [Pseudomarimonas salicorniae]|uniref:VOC family protein n=1 Tax=Pseudomarimonas salicorniae TaxID=2933270 RepID=A0ABT0GLE8_9GAMM|nr:VOC family protein [Lysobacter sp. CAU 1642]MCK7595064.1 VOC family protein [Lysobacter sp. CAU 1642]